MPLGNSFGYPVATADELGLTDYFRKNPKVAGMAWGGGMNGSPKDAPRVLVANPFNAQIAKPEKMQGLLKIEAARHLMDETGYTPEFDLSEEQQEWRKTLGKYADDDLAAKQTIVSRIMVNDVVPGVTPEQRKDANKFNEVLDERENPNFVKTILKGLEDASGLPRPWELTPGTSVVKEFVAGDEGDSIGEKVRKGAARFVGRIATNVANPALEFDLPSPSEVDLKAIAKDEAPWLNPEYYADETDPKTDPRTQGNEVLSRELFDLPSRLAAEDAGMEKTGPKEYTIKKGPLVPEGVEEGLHYNALLGRYMVTKNPETGELEYKDVWDISSPVGGSKVKNPLIPGGELGNYGQEQSLISHFLREIINPYLRPATVKGKTR